MTNRSLPAAERISQALREAYASAGLVPGLPRSAIAPLQRLVSAQPLIVDEVRGLTRRTANAHVQSDLHGTIDTDTADEALAGFLYANTAGGWILVERLDPVVRRRFTVAHELGHYLLHWAPLRDRDGVEFKEEVTYVSDDGAETGVPTGVISVVQETNTNPSSDRERLEEEANQFAAEILMPEHLCRRLAAEHSDRHGRTAAVLARRLASEFLVSQTAMLRRLKDLGFMVK